MLEKLRNMEPLSHEEESRINHRLRLAVILVAAGVLAFVIWSIVSKKGLSPAYYALVVVLLLTNWGLSDVAPIFLCRALAGRTRKQVNAYLMIVLFGLVANIGLGWFLLALQNQSIYGALLYLLGVTFSRKQREIYNSTDEEEEEEPQKPEPEEVKPDHLPTAADRLKRLNEISAQLDQEADAEENDGSV